MRSVLEALAFHGTVYPLGLRKRLALLKSNLALSLACLIGKSQQVLIKPGDGLVEGLLLGPPLDLDRGVTTDGETVLHANFSDDKYLVDDAVHTSTPLNRLIW